MHAVTVVSCPCDYLLPLPMGHHEHAQTDTRTEIETNTMWHCCCAKMPNTTMIAGVNAALHVQLC